MYVMSKTRLFWWPVIVKMPSAETPGAVIEQTCEVQFEAIGRDEARSLRDELVALEPEEFERREDDLMRRVVRGWRDIEDEDGVSVPFTAETFAALWQISWFRIGVQSAFAAAMNGEEARKGN